MSRDLILAISKGELGNVNECIKKIVDINYRHICESSNNPDKVITPLILAAAKGDIKIIQLLLTVKGIDPLVVSGIGRTAFMVAAANGHLEACKLLFPKNILAVDNSKLTAYENAVVNLRTYKDENFRNKVQEVIDFLRIPTFTAACEANNLDLVKWMVEHDKIEVEDVLKIAINTQEVREYLLSVSNFQQALFVQACANDNLDTVKELIALGADVNGFYKDLTGLLAACAQASGQVIYHLLTIPEIKVNLRNNIGTTALHQICTTTDKEPLSNPEPQEDDEQVYRISLADKLIAAGARVNAKTSVGLSPLFLATFYNQLGLVKFLILRGAEVKFKHFEIGKETKNNEKLGLDHIFNTHGRAEIREYLRSVIQSDGQVSVQNLLLIPNLFFVANPTLSLKAQVTPQVKKDAEDERSAELVP